MPRPLVVLLVLAAATGLGLWWRARNGRFTAVPEHVRVAAAATAADPGPSGAPRAHSLTEAEIGAPLGTVATFLQLSSEVCAPCRRVRAVLGELAADTPGLAHVEVDVADHLDLVRRLGIMRTPTVLLLDPTGIVVGRMSGALDRRHAVAALESCPGFPAPGATRSL